MFQIDLTVTALCWRCDSVPASWLSDFTWEHWAVLISTFGACLSTQSPGALVCSRGCHLSPRLPGKCPWCGSAGQASAGAPGSACSGSGVNAELWSLPLGEERGNPGNEVPAHVGVGRLVSREGRGESPFLRGLPLLSLFSSSSSCGRGPALLVSVTTSFSCHHLCSRGSAPRRL